LTPRSARWARPRSSWSRSCLIGSFLLGCCGLAIGEGPRVRSAAGDRVTPLAAPDDQRLVVRSVGDVGGTVLRELLAQDRDDLLAEQVELLEHGLVRQRRMVDEEELALVVACRVAEAQGPFDLLLRRADGQRGLRREVLEAGPVTVDGGIVEVGAELAHGVLRVLAHEHLSAEPDDRLTGLAVPLVLIAPAVQLDHPRGVGGRQAAVCVEVAIEW